MIFLLTVVYNGGTIFLDHASGYVHCEHQTNHTAASVIESKCLFELELSRHARQVKQYHTNNGKEFTASALEQALLEGNQEVTCSGVGAKLQNGQVKCAMCLITEKAW